MDVLDLFFRIVHHAPKLKKYALVFLGTGKGSHDRIMAAAQKHGVDKVYVQEDRLGYLDTIQYQKEAALNVVLGSTEAHYTPSKVFQNLLVGQPVWLCTHEQSPVWEELNDWKSMCCVKWPASTKALDTYAGELQQTVEQQRLPQGNTEPLSVDHKIAPLRRYLEDQEIGGRDTKNG